MIIRTVLDLRPKLPKHLLQTVLLAASWQRYAHEFAPLEILTIGDMPSRMKDILTAFGATLRKTRPSPNDRFSKTSNTIQGAIPVPHKQILLLDNDVVFTGNISPLAELPRDIIYGAVSGGFRVSEGLWHIIDTDLGMRPVRAEYIPPKEQLRSLLNPEHVARKIDVAYVNGGVLLIPSGFDFRTTWETQQATMASFFDGHRLGCGSVSRSNMASLATTIGSYGKFDWLPIAYNYRHACFALGLCRSNEIKLVHMTGLGRREEARSPMEWVKEYWDIKMTAGLYNLKPVLAKLQFEERIATAHAVRDNIIGTIKDYDLDNLFSSSVPMCQRISLP